MLKLKNPGNHPEVELLKLETSSHSRSFPVGLRMHKWPLFVLIVGDHLAGQSTGGVPQNPGKQAGSDSWTETFARKHLKTCKRKTFLRKRISKSVFI